MDSADPEIEALSDSLIEEIVKVSGLPQTTAVQRLFRRLFHRATEHMAKVGVTTDRLIVQKGFPAAAAWMLSNWCRQVLIRGQEHIPREGPLLVLSNHAGTYDSVALSSAIGREDMKIMSNSFPFVMSLPHIAEHLILLTNRTADRVTGTRAAIRQLKEGGAVLLFGTGRLDPDPDIYPNAAEYIEHWSESIELFLQAVPDARLVISIISGMLSRRWTSHPVTWLQQAEWRKRRVAIFGQVLQQLFSPGTFFLKPRISFSPPLTMETLKRESGSEMVFSTIIEHGKNLLADHLQWEKSFVDGSTG